LIPPDRLHCRRRSFRVPTNIPLLGLVAVGCLLAATVTPDAQPLGGLEQVARPSTGRYIVLLRGNDDPLAMGTEAAGRVNGRLRHVYNAALKGFAADLPAAAARALADDPRVLSIEEDGALTLAATAQGVPSWGLDRINQRRLPLDSNDQSSGDGTGVNVHVIDTGIRVTHAEFGGRAFVAGDYVDVDGSGDDCHGHGTHVAATIGGATYGVAKNVTLWAHRVADCRGVGSTSALIAAVDAITGDTTRRPALVNISVTAPASAALDAAIARSMASGVTYVVAAGNGGIDAARLSPARIASAITVGAATADDRRARFSNSGRGVDIFAPGESIRSAAIDNDSAVKTMSGTSMAAAHVAGVAALVLGENPDAVPAEVHAALLDTATIGVLTGDGAESTDRLLFSPASVEEVQVAETVSDPTTTLAATATATVPYVTLVSPNGGDNWGVGSKQQIKWKHNLGEGSQVRLEVSRDGGATYTVLASAVANKLSAGVFNWVVTGPTSASTLIRVSWTGGKAVDVSDKAFRIAAPFITVTSPNGGETWVAGSPATVQWTDNLGTADQVEIRLSTNGGSSYPIVVTRTKADGKQGIAVQSAWLSSTARLQITWLNTPPVTDVSNTNFRISAGATPNQPPSVALSAPANGATFVAPANLTVSATAGDTDGTVARVDFYRGSTLLGSDTTSPYSIAWSNVPAGSYTLTAVARDDDGATTTSAARTIAVQVAATGKNVVFGASPDHNTLVTSYVVEIFAAGVNIATAAPIASRDLGKPAVLNGECTADVSAIISALPAGTYQVTVAAVGAGGRAQSAPFSFAR
jgi:hypothetical protein